MHKMPFRFLGSYVNKYVVLSCLVNSIDSGLSSFEGDAVSVAARVPYTFHTLVSTSSEIGLRFTHEYVLCLCFHSNEMA